jgi:hypothetical protein
VEIWGTAWAQLGAVGLLAVFVLALLTGRLVARSSARDFVKLAADNAARWEAAAEASNRRADEQQRLQGEMLAALRAVEDLVRAKGAP